VFFTKLFKLVFCSLSLSQVSSPGSTANTTFGEINIHAWNYVKNSWVCKILIKHRERPSRSPTPKNIFAKSRHHPLHSWGGLLTRVRVLEQLAPNSHPSAGPFNCIVLRLRSCLVPQCSQPPHWPCHQRGLASSYICRE